LQDQKLVKLLNFLENQDAIKSKLSDACTKYTSLTNLFVTNCITERLQCRRNWECSYTP